MSRIEKALEKAGQLRDTAQKEDVRQEPAIQEPIVQPVDAALFKGEEAIMVDNPFLAPLNEPDSVVAEEYRKLKSMVVKLTEKGSSCNTIMISSSVGGEGKSLTALNLAISLAQEYDHTVLLVDADMRRPSIASYLGIDPSIGLSDCLAGNVDIKDALIKTGIGKLAFMHSGSRVSDPAEMLSSNRMKEFIAEIKHRYPDRYIIIDTPPVLLFAETHSLGTMVDGVLFVVKEDLAAQNDIKEALGVLKGSKILGVVYNGAEGIDRQSHYYGYGYRYGKKG